ncbi:NIPSNAP family protein [Marinilongibacter aquaticus]|uniref:NIPSNAP family protein n=1 Tax=Marinilongibacter aquaticus TaxID=2975157 RepID=UPI0021BD5C64|nr:NIPSNAP family protein [Marinilongibacter aquaticus]UBM58189.1 NIPSNAP family protein [Marinilongibacter aquaticus]
MKRNILFLFLFGLSLQAFSQNEFYSLSTYTLKFGSSANALHQYLEEALIPALNRQGVQNIGAFEEQGQSLPGKVYLFVPYASMSQYEQVQNALKKDSQFAAAAEKYHSLDYGKTPYASLTVAFFTAFDGHPKLTKPRKDAELFELRTYQSGIEEAAIRKVKMFNEGELDIFNDTGLYSVFFGSRIAGPQMPSLTYMLGFKDMAERDANWDKFVKSPAWKSLSGEEEYANLLINIDRVFLKRLAYSEL